MNVMKNIYQKINICFVLLTAMLALASCSQSTTTSDHHLVEVVDTSSVFIDCLWMNDLQEQYRIDDSAAYKDLAQYKVKEYDTCILPTIDFQKYTLISLKTEFGGCQETPIIRQVLRDDSQKKITYKVTVSGCGDCAKNHGYMNWLKIPKVNFDYQILYDKHIGHFNTNDSCK